MLARKTKENMAFKANKMALGDKLPGHVGHRGLNTWHIADISKAVMGSFKIVFVVIQMTCAKTERTLRTEES